MPTLTKPYLGVVHLRRGNASNQKRAAGVSSRLQIYEGQLCKLMQLTGDVSRLL